MILLPPLIVPALIVVCPSSGCELRASYGAISSRMLRKMSAIL